MTNRHGHMECVPEQYASVVYIIRSQLYSIPASQPAGCGHRANRANGVKYANTFKSIRVDALSQFREK